MNGQGTRAVLRIARRNISRDRWRSVLVGLLIMVPVAGMVGGITWMRTTSPTPDAQATEAMGAADLLVHATPPQPAASTDELRALLPAGSQIEPVATMDGALVLPGRLLSVELRATDLEGLGRGTLQLIEGRLPATPHEAAVSASVAASAGVRVGESVQVADGGPLYVVGLIENPSRLSSRVVLLHPSLAAQPAGAPSYWLVALPQGEPAPALGPMFDADPRQVYSWQGDQSPGVLILGAMALIETVLIGAAAFAVSIRRRQRDLGLLAAAGASRSQLAGTVLGEGMVLAGVASAVGVIVGIAVMALATPWLDQLTDHRNPALVMDPVAIGLAASVGWLAGSAAAAVPAWTAARLPVLVALSGRRPPESSARRTLIVGLALIGLSVALTATAAWLLLAHTAASAIAPLMLVAGAMLGVLGFGACSPWLVERLEFVGRRAPAGLRIALRDTARARSRTAPIVTATLAGLAAAIAVSSLVAYSSSRFFEGWTPTFRQDQLLLTGRPYELPRLAAAVADELGAVAVAPMPDVVRSTDGSERHLRAFVTSDGDAAAVDPVEGCSECLDFAVNVGSPELLRAIGVPAELSVLPPGSVLLLFEGPFEARNATLAIEAMTGQEETPDGDVVRRFGFTQAETITARAVAVGASAGPVRRFPNAYIAPETAARLGFELPGTTYGYLIRLDRGVTEADVAIAASIVGEAGYVESSFPPTDPYATTRVLAVLVSVLLALTVTAIAVALGEQEARADQRTLLAIGADPGVRRRIAAARAGVLAVLAAVLALPAGLLPVWGLLASHDEPLTVPLPELVLIVGVLPLVAIAGALFLSPPIPQWTAFRDVAPGS